MIDNWLIEDIQTVKERFPDVKVIEALVYNSLFASYKRFKKRNKATTKLDSSRRTYGQLICGYVKLYRLTNKSDQKNPSFTKSKIQELFREIGIKVISNFGLDKTHTVYGTELTINQLRECRNELIMDDLEEEPVFFEPKNQYDILLNYENTTPELAAIFILQRIKELNVE